MRRPECEPQRRGCCIAELRLETRRRHAGVGLAGAGAVVCRAEATRHRSRCAVGLRRPGAEPRRCGAELRLLAAEAAVSSGEAGAEVLQSWAGRSRCRCAVERTRSGGARAWGAEPLYCRPTTLSKVFNSIGHQRTAIRQSSAVLSFRTTLSVCSIAEYACTVDGVHSFRQQRSRK